MPQALTRSPKTPPAPAPTRWTRRNITITAACFAAYVAALLLFSAYWKVNVGAFSILPLTVGGWLLGQRIALGVGFATVPLTIAGTSAMRAQPLTALFNNWPAWISCVLLAWAAGWVRELYDERRRVANELELAKREAESATEAKSRFFTAMSHELRTPLNAILGYTDLMLEEIKDGQSVSSDADLLKIRSSGRHLLALLNSILDMAKIESGGLPIQIEPIDIGALVQELTDVIEPLVKQNKNRLNVRVDDGVGSMLSDPTKIRQVLFNVLSNAAKFTKDGEISLAVRREGEKIVFLVADTGIGVTPEQMATLFQPFTQASEEIHRRYGGTGLGLSISRRLCALLGGDVELTSTPAEGTVAKVTLPIRAPTPAVAPASDRAAA